MLNTFLKEHNLLALNTSFQKRTGQKWTFTAPNGSKAQLDYLLINTKWRNSAKDCRAYNTFAGVRSDHRIVSAKIRLTLRANKVKSSKNPPFDWSSLKKDPDIANRFTVHLRNRFDALQTDNENNSPNTTFNNFVLSCEEAAQETIPLKKKTKRHVPWDTNEIVKKRDKLRKMLQLKNADPSTINITNFESAKFDLDTTYEKEQTKYLKGKIDEINNASVNHQSLEAWKTINEVSGRKTSNKAKLKASSEQERLKLWKEHFQSLLGSNTTDNDTQINQISERELDIKKGDFTLDELNIVLKNTKNKKACGLDNIPAEVWKLGNFNDTLLSLCNAVYHGNPIDKWREGCILPFPKKGDLGIASNYRGITLTSIAAKIYNTMILNRLRPHLNPILRRNQNGFRQNRSTNGQILTIRRIIEGAKEQNLPLILLFIDFSKAFALINRQKMKQIMNAYGIPKETVTAIMMLYKNTKSMVKSPDGDTEFFNITKGVLQGDTLAPYLFVLCLDYIMKMSADSNIDLGFTLQPSRSRRYPAIKITDADYADDLCIISDYLDNATVLLHQIEDIANKIGLVVNAKKTEFMAFNQLHTGSIKSMLNNNIHAVQEFTYLGSNIASTKHDMEIRLAKAWSALNKLDKIWKSHLPSHLKRHFFRATIESVLIYGATSWTLTSSLEKRLDGAYTRMLRAVLNISWRQHPSKSDLYGDLPCISETLRDRRLRFAGHCYRSKD